MDMASTKDVHDFVGPSVTRYSRRSKQFFNSLP
jgi:hypothetical protein